MPLGRASRQFHQVEPEPRGGSRAPTPAAARTGAPAGSSRRARCGSSTGPTRPAPAWRTAGGIARAGCGIGQGREQLEQAGRGGGGPIHRAASLPNGTSPRLPPPTVPAKLKHGMALLRNGPVAAAAKSEFRLTSKGSAPKIVSTMESPLPWLPSSRLTAHGSRLIACGAVGAALAAAATVATTTLPSPFDLRSLAIRVSVPKGGSAEVAVSAPVPWCRVARVFSSCPCLTVAPQTDGSTRLRIDLISEPEAKSFAPTVQLVDAGGTELFRLEVDVQVTRQTTTREASASPTSVSSAGFSRGAANPRPSSDAILESAP